MTDATDPDPTSLPAAIRAFLVAHEARDPDAAIATFTPRAEVVDDGRTFRGTDEVLTFLQRSGAEFRYTTELVGVERIDAEHWAVHNRLEGDFPGGVVDLRYRFTLDGGRIGQLVIAP